MRSKICIARYFDKKVAQCVLCKKDIGLSTIGIFALDSHASGKNLEHRVKEQEHGLF